MCSFTGCIALDAWRIFRQAGTVEYHIGEINSNYRDVYSVTCCCICCTAVALGSVSFSQNMNAIVCALQTNCFTDVFSFFQTVVINLPSSQPLSTGSVRLMAHIS